MYGIYGGNYSLWMFSTDNLIWIFFVIFSQSHIGLCAPSHLLAAWKGLVIPETEGPESCNVHSSKVLHQELESIIGYVSLVSSHSISKDNKCTKKVNEVIPDSAIVNYIERTPSVCHNVKEFIFFRTLRSGRVFLFRWWFN